MSTSTILFDVPGPRAQRRQRIGTFSGGLVLLALIGLALWRLGRNGQLDPARWSVLFDPNSGVPQAFGTALVNTLEVAAVAMVAA
ncbi:MAG: amino acid ABC transporter permease, partial [Blastococcus sp.]